MEQNVSFMDYLKDKPKISEYIAKQIGTYGEGFVRIVCINDTKEDSRCIIEYTSDQSVAKRFSFHGIGYICINIAPSYVLDVDKQNLEKAFFCVSSAHVEINSITVYSDVYNHCMLLQKWIKLYDKKRLCKVEIISNTFASSTSSRMPLKCATCKFKL